MKSRKYSAFIKGSGLVMFGSVFTALLQFLLVIVLSRLLSPEEFGLIAMVLVFVSIGHLFRDFGMPSVALQAPSLSNQQLSNLFWMNAGTAAISALAVAISTPLVAKLYNEPAIALIMPVLAITIFLLGVSAQLQTQLARSMRYQAMVASDVVSQIAGAGTAIILAVLGFGYWALVAQYLATSIILLIACWTSTGWFPKRFRRGFGSRAMVGSGAQFGASTILTFLQSNADTFLIGFRLGPLPVGFYNRGYQLSFRPVSQLASPLTRVVVPTVNKLKNEGKPYLPFLLKVQFYLTAAIVLVLAICAGTAKKLVPFLLGDGWEPVVTIFQILVLGSVFSVLNVINYWAFLANQLSKELMNYNLITKPMTVLFMLFGTNFGVSGVAWGMVAGVATSWPIGLIWISKSVEFTGMAFFKNGSSIIFSAVGAAITAWTMTMVFSAQNILVMLLLAAVAAAIVYMVLISIRKKNRIYLREVFTAIRK